MNSVLFNPAHRGLVHLPYRVVPSQGYMRYHDVEQLPDFHYSSSRHGLLQNPSLARKPSKDYLEGQTQKG